MIISQIPDEGVSILTTVSQSLFRNQDSDSWNGRAYIGHAGIITASGFYTHCQLFNPVGSGVVVLLDEIVITMDRDGEAQLRYYSTALSGAAQNWYSKRPTLTNGKAELRATHELTQLGTLIGRTFQIWSDTIIWPFQRPFALEESEGIQLCGGITDNSPQVTFSGREIPA